MKYGMIRFFCSLMLLVVLTAPAQAKRYWNAYVAADARNFDLSTRDCMVVNPVRQSLHMVYGGDHLYHSWVASNEWHDEVIDGSPAVGTSASIAVRPDGTLAVIYMDVKNHRLMFASNQDGSWNTSSIAEGQDIGRYNSIDCGSGGEIQIAYSDAQANRLNYAWLNASSQWVISTVNDHTSGKECSLKIFNNQPRITYFDETNHSVKTAIWNGSAWVNHTVVAEVNQGWSAVGFLVDTTDLWHYVYYDNQSTCVYYTTFRPGGWPDEAYWVDTAGPFDQMDLEMTPSGDLMVAYTDANTKKLKVARGINDHWDVSVVETGSGYALKNPGLEVWNDAVQYVLYLNQDTFDLKLGINQAALDWINTRVDTASSYLTDTALAIDSLMRPHLLVRNNKRDLGYHCYHDGSGWSTAVPPFPGSIDSDFDFHFLPDGKPIAVYVNNDAGTLELAVYDGNRWNTRAIVTEANSIAMIRMAIGSHGSVHLVYQSAKNLNLVYMSASSWQGPFTSTILDETRSTWLAFDMVLNSNDLPIICYPAASTDNLRLKHMSSAGSWQTLDFSSKYKANYRITVDRSNTIHMAAYNDDYQKLYHIWNEGGHWQEEVVVDSGTFWPTLDIDTNPDGDVCLAYVIQSSTDQIRYAVRHSGSWIMDTVSSMDRYALELSLVHDPQGIPHIAIGSSYTSDVLAYEGFPAVSMNLWMNDVVLQPGDRFLLKHNCANHSAHPVTANEYIVLEIDGAMWFWPGWSSALDCETVTLPAAHIISEPIMDFTWPAGVGTLFGLRFWGALLYSPSQALIMYDVIEWQTMP
ncbi:hypothetical protein JXA80_13990 [bacterium]|nr:hypothetical protein [candidate division CSSED10-310 bacterium]